MLIQINFKSGVPVYLQIIEQIKYLGASSGLKPGDPLPSIRELAQELRVNRNTIAKAYTELERQNVVETVRGKGVFLSGNRSPFEQSFKKEVLERALDAAIVQAHHFQIDDEKLLSLFKKRLESFQKRRDAS